MSNTPTLPAFDPTTARPLGGDLPTFDPSTARGLGTSPTAPSAPQESLFHEVVDIGKLGTALIYSNLLGADPHFAYDNHDEITKRLSEIAPDFAARVSRAQKVEDDPLSLAIKKQLPEPFESHDLLENFIHDTAEFIKDPTMYGPAVIGTALGYPRAGADVGFSLSAGLRQMYTEKLQKGEVTSIGELGSRAAHVLHAAGMGLVQGEIMHFAGMIPVGPIAASPMVSMAVKGLYQSAAVTAATALLQRHMPSLEDFEKNAVTITGLNLITHGVSQAFIPTPKQGLLDVYTKDGTTPQETTTRLQAQPPVKEQPKPGLQPAIRITAKDGSKQIITGEYATHSDLAEAQTGDRPVTIEQLESDPKLANKVLNQPEIQVQQVIDRAYELLPTEDAGKYPSELKSGRGFAMIKGDTTVAYMNRKQSERWVKANEPEVHEMWKQSHPEEGAEFHSADYNEAHARVNQRNLLEGDPDWATADPELAQNIAQGRAELNEVKAGNQSKAYGKEVLRTFLVGTNNMLRAEAQQVVGRLKKLVPDKVDRAAITFMRDYRDNPQQLRQEIDNLKGGDWIPVTRGTIEGREKLRGYAGSDETWFIQGHGESAEAGARQYAKEAAQSAGGGKPKIIKGYVRVESVEARSEGDPIAVRNAQESFRETLPEGTTNEKLKTIIPAMERALNPSPEMLDADRQMTAYFAKALSQGRNFLGMDSSIDPSRYSPRLFALIAEELEGGARAPVRAIGGGARFSTRTPHMIERGYFNILDPLKEGDVEARTFDSIDELSIYGDRHARAVSNAIFGRELLNTELGVRGNTVTQNEEGEYELAAPRNWVDLPGSGKLVTKIDPNTGEARTFDTGIKVPPDVAKALQPLLEGDTITREGLAKAAKVSQGFIKSLELGLVPFHLRAMSLTFINNAGIDAYREALVSDNNSPQFESDERVAASHGVTTTKTSAPFEAYRGIKETASLDRKTLLRQGIEGADKVFGAMTRATFEVAQRKFKVIDFTTRRLAWEASHPNATPTEHGKAMRGFAKEINSAYGGLNWEVMGVTKNWQAIARLVLLAPDWTFSNFVGMKYAATDWKGTAGTTARWYLLKSLATGYAMTQGMSIALTGKPSDQWDKVHLGTDRNNKEMYTSLFFAGLPKDFITLSQHVQKDGLFQGFEDYAGNKLGPFAGAADRLHQNKDWQGKPITKRTDTGLEKTGKGALFLGEQLLPAPFTIKDMVQRAFDPNEDVTYKDFLTGVVGAQVYHEAPRDAQGNPIKQSSKFTLKGGSGSRKFKLRGGQ